jgi:hypothetical protein
MNNENNTYQYKDTYVINRKTDNTPIKTNIDNTKKNQNNTKRYQSIFTAWRNFSIVATT